MRFLKTVFLLLAITLLSSTTQAQSFFSGKDLYCMLKKESAVSKNGKEYANITMFPAEEDDDIPF